MAKLNLKDQIRIPEEVSISIEETFILVKGPKGELKRRSFYPGVIINKSNSSLIFEISNSSKREKMMMKTLEAHVKNMIEGVRNGFEYSLKICAGHFPMTVNKQDNEIIIKNFLGEKIDRKSRVLDGVNVEINKDIITLSGIDKELVGQTAANLEKTTKIKNRDRRRFQDGIFIIKKSGVEL